MTVLFSPGVVGCANGDCFASSYNIFPKYIIYILLERYTHDSLVSSDFFLACAAVHHHEGSGDFLESLGGTDIIPLHRAMPIAVTKFEIVID